MKAGLLRCETTILRRGSRQGKTSISSRYFSVKAALPQFADSLIAVEAGPQARGGLLDRKKNTFIQQLFLRADQMETSLKHIYA